MSVETPFLSKFSVFVTTKLVIILIQTNKMVLKLLII